MWGSAGSRLGVYATPNRQVALAFAMGSIPDENGRVTKVMLGLNPVQMIYVEGHPNLGGKGYLYTMLNEDFEQVDELQWVSQKPVTPLEILEFNVDDYNHMFRHPTKEDLRVISGESKNSVGTEQ